VLDTAEVKPVSVAARAMQVVVSFIVRAARQTLYARCPVTLPAPFPYCPT